MVAKSPVETATTKAAERIAGIMGSVRGLGWTDEFFIVHLTKIELVEDAAGVI